MAVKTFASIYIGSYELSLKVFELSSKKKLKEIDHIKSRINLGRDVYETGGIGYETVDELCDVLREFVEITKSYRVNACEVYASAAIRDAENEYFVLNQIQIRTGLQVKMLSNSEHRFMTYETVAGSEHFEKIAKSAAIVDIGGMGIQITLFDEGNLITTQHLDIGTLRLRNLFLDMGYSYEVYKYQLAEFIHKKLEVFRSMYLSKDVEYIVFINEYSEQLIGKMDKASKPSNVIKTEKFLKFIDKLQGKTVPEITKELNLPSEDSLIIPSIMLFQCLIDDLGAKYVFGPGTNINDGIAFDYARENGFIQTEHDFDADIISASRNLAEHYNSFSPHIDALYELSSQVFNSMKKVHGLNKRHLLLLRVATLLHDVGKYISLANSPMSAYNIIMESEIIGLTHLERQIVAYTVLFNTLPLMDLEDLPDSVDQDSYLVFAKLSAILRVANALDQSHKQKFGNVKCALKERELIITVEATEDISLEKALFTSKTKYFEAVFAIKPVLKEKRVYNYTIRK